MGGVYVIRNDDISNKLGHSAKKDPQRETNCDMKCAILKCLIAFCNQMRVSFIWPRFQDCHNFLLASVQVHTNGVKTPETNNVSGVGVVLFQPTDQP